jgi:uncharacterized protein (DUF983 family)
LSRNIFSALLSAKCPRCREGNIFVNKSVFPLKEGLRIEPLCTCCGAKLVPENNYGQGMNFVFIFVIFGLTYFLYWAFIGISLMDNSIFYYLGIATVLTLVLQPWLMRLSRVLFMYLVIKHDPNALPGNK